MSRPRVEVEARVGAPGGLGTQVGRSLVVRIAVVELGEGGHAEGPARRRAPAQPRVERGARRERRRERRAEAPVGVEAQPGPHDDGAEPALGLREQAGATVAPIAQARRVDPVGARLRARADAPEAAQRAVQAQAETERPAVVPVVRERGIAAVEHEVVRVHAREREDAAGETLADRERVIEGGQALARPLRATGRGPSAVLP